jgi:cell division protein FtsB
VKPLPRFSLADATGLFQQHARHILGLALLALCVHDIFGAHGFLAMRRTQQQIRQTRDQIEKLNGENKSLAEQVHALKTDPKAIERVAREQMGLARPGEMIYRLPESPKAADSPSGTPQD